jgi:hypothetical protein
MTMNRITIVALKLFLICAFAVFTSGAGLFASKNDELATDKTIKNKKPWANIDGFRSAKLQILKKEKAF